MSRGRTTMTAILLCVTSAGLPAQTAARVKRPAKAAPAGVAARVEADAPREAAYRENNLGVAYLEQYDYRSAADAFRRSLGARPTFDLARVNLAIALFYVPDLPAAKAMATEAIALQPDSPQLNYVLALVARLEDQLPEAEARLRKVLASDPDDFGTNLVLAQVLTDEERYDDALPFFDRAAAAEPMNATVLYSRAMSLGRGGKREESQKTMVRFQELRNNPAHSSFGKTYLEQGRYAEALASTGAESDLVDRATPAVAFVELSGAVPPRPASASPIRLILVDLDGDGRLDAVETGAFGVRVLRNEGGRFSDLTPVSGVFGPAQAVAAGDYDNDGRPDMLFVRPNGLSLFHNEGQGRFKDATAAAGFPAVEGPPATAAFADVDHDGDLDIFLPGLLLQNNGNGTFMDVSEKAKVGAGRGLAVAPTDYDNGRDLDLIVLRDTGRLALLKNRRDGSFDDVAHELGLPRAGPFRALALADWNKDSYPDLFLGSDGVGSVFAWSDGRGHFTTKPAPSAAGGAQAAQAIDYDNDGLLDLLVVTASGPRLFRSLGSAWEDVTATALPVGPQRGELDGAALAIGDLDGDGDEDVLLATGVDTRLLSNEGGNRQHSFVLTLDGRISNKAAVGAKIDLRAGSLRQKVETSAAVPMVAPADILFGLGARTTPDSVRVIWVSGIVQTETTFPASTTAGTRTSVSLTELDRKPSSCPYLYAWNGERFEFVTDFLGAGEMGYWEAPGVRSEPDPVEYVRIAPSQLRAKGGRYELRVTNELEETLYLDRVHLLAVDHPVGVELYPDEGMTHQPKAFRLFAVADVRTPKVTDSSGDDATELATAVDRRFVEGFALERIRGYAKEHALILDLSALRASHQVLLLTGWTDYAFSSDNVAASQMKLGVAAPRLEIETSPGEWTIAAPDVGIPVGRPQTVVVDLTGMPLGPTSRVRLVTSMRIYWDRIAVGRRVEGLVPQPHELQATRAVLRERGFSAEHAIGRLETLDYTQVSAANPWKTMPGRYTRTGDVLDLLRTADDRFVISRPGDEIALSFAVGRAPSPGYERTYLLVGDGFSKEMDINSASPDIVLPYPYHGMSEYPYNSWDAPDRVRRLVEQAGKWNTRVVARPLPSLELTAR